MSRSVKIVESVNGRESLGGGSLSFLGWFKTDARESLCLGRRQRADDGKTDPEREGVGDFLVDLSESEIRGRMTG